LFIFNIFTEVLPGFYKILTEKFWAAQSPTKQKQLFQLLLIWIIIGSVSLSLAIVHLISPSAQNCIICDFLLVASSTLAIVCSLNARSKCALNIVFSIPIFIYGYYISEFSAHLPPIETVHYTTWWLITGLVFLYFFSRSESRIGLFAV